VSDPEPFDLFMFLLACWCKVVVDHYRLRIEGNMLRSRWHDGD
jgi:hypothetical protein